ncbi:hypothetical protein VXM60_02595 [Shewanella khirikhana]|uniref:hypothetical protein n=1 Tax=Shewanella khirikhana TaxID=1965282 RepID=UPI0030D1D8F6
MATHWHLAALLSAALLGGMSAAQADGNLSTSVWVGNHNGFGVSYSSGGYGHWRYPGPYWNTGIGWGWRDPFYRDPFWRYNDSWYWQERAWERERQARREERAERERQRLMTQPRVVPPAMITRSEEKVEGLAALPQNARVLMVDGKPQYEWQGQRYSFDWQTQRYMPLKQE